MWLAPNQAGIGHVSEECSGFGAAFRFRLERRRTLLADLAATQQRVGPTLDPRQR
jgi:hypothetical protein